MTRLLVANLAVYDLENFEILMSTGCGMQAIEVVGTEESLVPIERDNVADTTYFAATGARLVRTGDRAEIDDTDNAGNALPWRSGGPHDNISHT